ncbi:hypothetical protein BEP19_16840 [Ammoniphilus oxalaticus]|uniref:Ribbon-helix-helix protein CopG domain-containing protein n=1 Tax=Ammoniphilus oxalaticus TaxID=66863 RepID=A0A419SQC5_9BACL|nr:hypothetical protein [Ammoniphilus oxalaticus]RKD26503.1 hypothetical protein BEP19_16840 [Ammoniphilus oxalaticus]
MNILIRDVHPATINKIDELAKQKGISRQEYLREHLEAFAVSDLHFNLMDRYEKQLEVNTMLLEKNAKKMDEMIAVFTQLMFDE